MALSRRTCLKLAGTAAVGGLTSLAGCLGDDEVVTIGHLGPLSGPFSLIGEPSQNGADLAIDELNEQSDIEYELLHRDTENDASTGVQRSRELVQEQDADVLLGISSSAVARAVSEFAGDQGNVVTNVTIAQTPVLTREECRRETFRTAGHLEQLNWGLARTVSEIADGTRVAGLIPNYVFGEQTWEAFQHFAEQEMDEVEFVYETFPDFGQGDFQSEIQAILDAEPDMVYTSMWAGDLTTFIGQAQEFDFFSQIPEFIAGSGAITDVSLSMGDDMAEMIALDRYYFEYPDSQRNNDFVEAYENEFGEIPVNVAQETYAGAYAIDHAIQESGGTSTDDIIDGLEGLEFEAPEGTKHIRAEDHQAIEENVWTGRIGPVDGLDFYGFTEMHPVSGEEVTEAPQCEI